jgi:hypothetical protein
VQQEETQGDDDGDVGHAEEQDHTSQEETCKAEEGAVELARQGATAEEATADANAAAEEGPAQPEEADIKEVAAAEVIAPCTATDGTAVEEVAAADAPSDQLGQGEPRETAEEAMEEASAGVGRGGISS